MMTPSYFSEDRISSPDRAPRENSATIESFSNAGRSTFNTSGSREITRQSNSMLSDGIGRAGRSKVTNVLALRDGRFVR
jgi:hypothetical protein